MENESGTGMMMSYPGWKVALMAAGVMLVSGCAKGPAPTQQGGSANALGADSIREADAGKQASRDSSKVVVEAEDWEAQSYLQLENPPDPAGVPAGYRPYWKRRTFAKSTNPSVPDTGEMIRWSIEQGLKGAYERPDFEALRRIFSGKGECILAGKVGVDSSKRRDSVQYFWVTVDTYLGNLKAAQAKGKSFEVGLSLLRLYRDPSPELSDRYWAIVKQGWATKSGEETTYMDEGFLFLNFRFDKGGKVSDFKIDYRLWLYDYRYDLKEPALARWERLNLDIGGFLEMTQPMHGKMGEMIEGKWRENQARRGLRLVERILVEKMKEDLVGAKRLACCPDQAKTK